MFWIFWDHYLKNLSAEESAAEETAKTVTGKKSSAASRKSFRDATPDNALTAFLESRYGTPSADEEISGEEEIVTENTVEESSVPELAEETVADAQPAASPLPAQDKYQYLTAFSNEALCVFSDTGECAYLSPNWQRITGFEVAECLGAGLLQKIHPEHQFKIKEKLAELAQAENFADIRTKCQIAHTNGETQWYDMSFAALQENATGGKEIVCVLRNIHQDVVAQKNLHKAKLEAELALRARSEFLANMSHELRTPLNAIIGFAQIMRDGMFGTIDNPKYQDYMENIHESGHLLLAKINDLLEIANLDSGRVKLSEEEFDIMTVIRHVIQVHSHHAFSSHITIREQLFRDPVIVRADRVKMQQVLSNVLSNALRYNRETGTVTVSTRISVTDNLVIAIKDSGQGIEPDQLSNIVNVFKQKDNFFTREMAGIGLGLSLVKEFVILHGGHFHIDSKSGKGTTVYITLPADRILSLPETDSTELQQQAV